MKAVAKAVEVDFYEIESWAKPSEDGDRIVHCSEYRSFVITPAMTARVDDLNEFHYVVVQSDGYVYLNPKDVFERKYQPK